MLNIIMAMLKIAENNLVKQIHYQQKKLTVVSALISDNNISKGKVNNR
ncbi:hypothetical protein [Aureibaculum marinum]|nr:hypothetical protein [Aureibaculum marinum]